MSVRRSRALVGRKFMVLSFLAAGALADPVQTGSFRLDWSGPTGCPSSADLLARIERLLGASVSEALKVPLAARGRVEEPHPGAFALSLETFQNEQRFIRRLEAPSCSELGDAAALVLALAIDPELRTRMPDAALAKAPPPDPTPVPSTSAAPSAAPPPNAAPSPVAAAPPRAAKATSSTQKGGADSPGRRPALGWFVGAFASVDFGSVAPFALGPAITGGARFQSFELALDATWLPARRTPAEADPNKGGDITLVAFALRPCFVFTLSGFEPGVCAAAELGRIQGDGYGTAADSTRAALWPALGATLFGRYRIGAPFWLSLHAGLLAPLQHIEFTLENVGMVYEVPPLVGRVALGAEAHFD